MHRELARSYSSQTLTQPRPKFPSGSRPPRFTLQLAWAKQRAQASSPLPELLEDHSVRKALAADADALKDAITAQLVQHQVRVQFASLERKAHVDGLTTVPRSQ